MEATELPKTSVEVPVGLAKAKPRFDPTRIFVEKDRLVWFWFGFAMLILVGAAIDRFALIHSLKQTERVIVIDPSNTFYVAPLLKFEEAKGLHVEQSTLATIAFLERNPNGFDNEDLPRMTFQGTCIRRCILANQFDWHEAARYRRLAGNKKSPDKFPARLFHRSRVHRYSNHAQLKSSLVAKM